MKHESTCEAVQYTHIEEAKYTCHYLGADDWMNDKVMIKALNVYIHNYFERMHRSVSLLETSISS